MILENKEDNKIINDFTGLIAYEMKELYGINSHSLKLSLDMLGESKLRKFISTFSDKIRSNSLGFRFEVIVEKINDILSEEGDLEPAQAELLNTVIENINKYKDTEIKFISKINKLKEVLDLTDIESLIVQCLYVFADYEISFRDILTLKKSEDSLIRFFKKIGKCSYDEIVNVISENSKLFKNGIIYFSTEEMFGSNSINLNLSAYLYLSSGEDVSLTKTLCKKVEPEIEYSDFHIKESDKLIALKMLQNIEDAKILIVGPSGVGKTSFAMSLAYEAGLDPYILEKNESFNLAVNGTDNDTEIVIVDEADDILRDNSKRSVQSNKTVFNKAIDNINKHCIFIANDTITTHDSIFRRFNHIIEFKDLSAEEKIEQWMHNVPNITKILSDEEIAHYAKKYDVSISIVARAVDDTLLISRNKIQRKEFFKSIIKKHNKFRNQNPNILKTLLKDKENTSGKKNKNVSNFSLDFINTDINKDVLIDYMSAYLKSQEDGKDFRCSMLFQGMPGTGKTEFARYLANSLGLKSITISVSDILNKYIGESEKNIKSIFKKAKKKNLVLIFDELDSFLYNRNYVNSSYEVSQVNEFLSQLDNYKGIIIGTTNYSNKFDKAALRRFTWKVNFKAISKENRIKAIKDFLPNIDFNSYTQEIESLDKLTAGDLFVVSEKYKYMDKIDGKTIIDAIKLEIKYKQEEYERINSIGF